MQFRRAWLLPMAAYGLGGGIIAAIMASHGAASPGRSTAVASAPVIAVGDADDSPSYDDWVDQTLTKLSGDDGNEQNKAADQLTMAVVYPKEREKVLAGLEPHLFGDNSDFRIRCVRAYGHWATEAQVPELLKVVETPRHPENTSGVENVWAAAVSAMVNLDTRSAEKGIQMRMGIFTFRVDVTGDLVTMTADASSKQPTEFAFLKEIDPSNENVQLSVPQAEKLLESDSGDKRTKGARALGHAIVIPEERETVLHLLEPHLMGKNGLAREPFVQAYAHWADAKCIKNLIATVAYPDAVEGISGHENSWAAATVGLLRLDPQAAATAMKTREGSFFYRGQMHQQLDPTARGNGPNAANAAWLLTQLESGNDQPPLPPGFDPTAPAKPPKRVNPPTNGGL